MRLSNIFVFIFCFIVICVGIGSGLGKRWLHYLVFPLDACASLTSLSSSSLAPHMALIRDRVFASTNGVKVSPLCLYLGNRFEAREFLYRSELEHTAMEHGWFTLHTAFSRDVIGKKTYVQDLVAGSNDVREALLEKKGLLYVCGNRSLPEPLRNALVESFAYGKTDETSLSDARLAVEEMFIHGRSQQEVW